MANMSFSDKFFYGNKKTKDLTVFEHGWTNWG